MKKILFSILVSIFCSLFFLEQKTYIKCEAINDLETIGICYEVERVDERTRVTVTGDDIDVAIEAGRDLVLVSGPILPPGGPVRPASYGDVYVSGYYYATPEDGKIIARHELKNNLQSLLTMIRIVYNEAKTMSPDFDVEYANNLTLEYIRSFNPSYTSDKWCYIAGVSNQIASFVSYINSLNTGGINIRDFFGAFNLGGNYDGRNGNIDSYFLNKKLKMVDPVSGYANIDLLHFMASFDGVSFDTGKSELIASVYPGRIVEFILTWGGDLQTLCKEHSYSSVQDIDFESFLVDSYFSLEDLIADVDAYNSAQYFHLANEEITIWEHIQNYYINLNEYDRYLLFINKVSQNYGEDISLKKNLFTTAVYDMVSLNEYGIHKENGNSIIEIFDYKYALMKINRNIVVTQEVRKEISDQFVDYIFGKIL